MSATKRSSQCRSLASKNEECGKIGGNLALSVGFETIAGFDFLLKGSLFVFSKVHSSDI